MRTAFRVYKLVTYPFLAGLGATYLCHVSPSYTLEKDLEPRYLQTLYNLRIPTEL